MKYFVLATLCATSLATGGYSGGYDYGSSVGAADASSKGDSSSQGYNAQGYNKAGWNKDGYNSLGYNKDGYNKDGWNMQGYNKAGWNKDGYNVDGYNKDGWSKEGYNKDGQKKEGASAQSYGSGTEGAQAGAADPAGKTGWDQKDPLDKVKVNPEVLVISQNWGGSYGEAAVNEGAAGAGKTHIVYVGGPAGLVYTPDSVIAEVGDYVQFNFGAKNHTVTQSTFDTPCIKKPDGVDSGFMPTDGTIKPAPSFKFQVKDKKPVWFYCKQKTGTHCGQGMTFSINPTAEKSQAKFKELAIAQNGTAAAAGPGYASAAPGGYAAPSPAPAAAAPAPSAPVAPAAAPTPSVVQGSGGSGKDSCDCSCLCGSGSFLPGAGVGSYGGYGGALPKIKAM